MADDRAARRCGHAEVCALLLRWSEICDARATRTSRKLKEERQRWEKFQAAGFVTPIVDLNVDFERLQKLEERSANQPMLRRLARLRSGTAGGDQELRRTMTGSCSCIMCVENPNVCTSMSRAPADAVDPEWEGDDRLALRGASAPPALCSATPQWHQQEPQDEEGEVDEGQDEALEENEEDGAAWAPWATWEHPAGGNSTGAFPYNP